MWRLRAFLEVTTFVQRVQGKASWVLWTGWTQEGVGLEETSLGVALPSAPAGNVETHVVYLSAKGDSWGEALGDWATETGEVTDKVPMSGATASLGDSGTNTSAPVSSVLTTGSSGAWSWVRFSSSSASGLPGGGVMGL